jgi:hypothetical protein
MSTSLRAPRGGPQGEGGLGELLEGRTMSIFPNFGEGLHYGKLLGTPQAHLP